MSTRRSQIMVTGVQSPVQVPDWMGKHPSVTVEPGQVVSIGHWPDIIVVRGKSPRNLLENRALIDQLVYLQKEIHSLMFLLEFNERASHDVNVLSGILDRFPEPLLVSMLWGGTQAPRVLSEVLAKVGILSQRIASDPLGGVKAVKNATVDLRNEKGRLSAKRVAGAFGLSVSELAEKILGRTRQSVFKTDDAESLQSSLLPFEKVARLKAVLNHDDFARWLRQPNVQLGDNLPIELIRNGEVEIVAELVNDMLVGNPT